jgi:hypothetical protein
VAEAGSPAEAAAGAAADHGDRHAGNNCQFGHDRPSAHKLARPHACVYSNLDASREAGIRPTGPWPITGRYGCPPTAAQPARPSTNSQSYSRHWGPGCLVVCSRRGNGTAAPSGPPPTRTSPRRGHWQELPLIPRLRTTLPAPRRGTQNLVTELHRGAVPCAGQRRALPEAAIGAPSWRRGASHSQPAGRRRPAAARLGAAAPRGVPASGITMRPWAPSNAAQPAAHNQHPQPASMGSAVLEPTLCQGGIVQVHVTGWCQFSR